MFSAMARTKTTAKKKRKTPLAKTKKKERRKGKKERKEKRAKKRKGCLKTGICPFVYRNSAWRVGVRGGIMRERKDKVNWYYTSVNTIKNKSCLKWVQHRRNERKKTKPKKVKTKRKKTKPKKTKPKKTKKIPVAEVYEYEYPDSDATVLEYMTSGSETE
jgi:hypothetical protein